MNGGASGREDPDGVTPEALTREVLDRCREADFALAGVCDATPSDHAEEIRAWIAGGRHGSMTWLEGRLDERLDPGTYVPGARSIDCTIRLVSRMPPPVAHFCTSQLPA